MTTEPPLAIAPIASSSWSGTPSLRTRNTSSGACSACATSYPTGTPPRGRARTTTSSRSRYWSRRPARTRPASRRSLKTRCESGGEVDPNRAQPFVQRFEGKLQDFAFGVSVVGDVPGIRWIERAGDQGQALDQCFLNDRCESLRVVANSLLQHLDAEIDVSGLIARHRGEAAIEPAV